MRITLGCDCKRNIRITLEHQAILAVNTSYVFFFPSNTYVTMLVRIGPIYMLFWHHSQYCHCSMETSKKLQFIITNSISNVN